MPRLGLADHLSVFGHDALTADTGNDCHPLAVPARGSLPEGNIGATSGKLSYFSHEPFLLTKDHT